MISKIHYFWWAILLTLALFLHHTTTDRQDGQDQVSSLQTKEKHFAVSREDCTDIAEVGATNRLGLKLLVY